jgi:hypothetical protein
LRDARHIHEQAAAKEGAVAEHGFEQGISRCVVREGQGEGRQVGVVALAGVFAPALNPKPCTVGIAGSGKRRRVYREGRTKHAAMPIVTRTAIALPQGKVLAKTAE